MYAAITTNGNIAQTLSYHEQKVKIGKAECILAANFMKDLNDLSRKDILFHFERINSLNHRAKQVTFHPSLDFHPSEKLSNRLMATLAREYMQKMGMDHKPYLVYRHYDSAHVHMHIVSTTIQENGKRIPLNKHTRHKSNTISRELEIKHSLRRWDPACVSKEEYAQLHTDRKVEYGQEPTNMAITKVLNAVMDKYNYTSLAELNILLRMYNVQALSGQKGSWLRQKQGLYYCILDEKGKVAGLPIKASAFYNKPTLKNLEKIFIKNKTLRLTNAIDHILLRQKPDFPGLRAALQKDQITTILQKDRLGQPANIWYIDQQTRCIFDGSALGGRYTAMELQQRCAQHQQQQKQEQQQNLRIRQNLHL